MLKITLFDTIEPMMSTDYRKRFIAEYNQLLIRETKLEHLLNTWDTLEFKPCCAKGLLEKQLDTMKQYRYILEDRAKVERVKLRG